MGYPYTERWPLGGSSSHSRSSAVHQPVVMGRLAMSDCTTFHTSATSEANGTRSLGGIRPKLIICEARGLVLAISHAAREGHSARLRRHPHKPVLDDRADVLLFDQHARARGHLGE